MDIDLQDRQLLRVLQNDGRVSNQQLAAETAMSTSACWRRMRSLEETQVIRGYTALLDPKLCGLSFHAVVHVQLARHDPSFVEGFIREIVHRPEVLDCFATAGEADYHLRVRCRDLDAYNSFLDGFLFKIAGVANVRTNLVMKEIKHDATLPV